jgi:beta-glucanase (GH16 family)
MSLHRITSTLLQATGVLATLCTAAISSRGVAQAPSNEGWSLVWSDEFSGASLDRTKWCTRYAHGGGAALEYNDPQCTGPGGFNGTGDFLKDERQRYRDHNARGEALHVVTDGHLTLKATRTGADSYAAYESAMIRSKLAIVPSTTACYFVAARVRLPSVRGSFAAFWMASGDGRFAWPPESDILEAALNGGEDKANMVRVGVALNGGVQTASRAPEIYVTGKRFDRTWHNFVADSSLRDVWIDVAQDWTKDGVCTYINGELVACERYRWTDNSGVPANPANLIVNLAVGGEWAGRYGIDDSRPMQMDIDYVRVFKRNTARGLPFPMRGSLRR